MHEILQFAIKKEQESFVLYGKLHELVDSTEVKGIFLELMEAEKKHKSFYEEMLKHSSKEQSPGVPINDEYQDYMQELVATSYAESMRALPEKILNVAEAIDFAIQREKDSILFYVGLKQFVSIQETLNVDDIIAEEAKHIVILVKVKKDHFAVS